MHRLTPFALGLGLALAPLTGQDVKPALPLLRPPADRQDPAPAPDTEFARLEADFNAAIRAWTDGYRRVARDAEARGEYLAAHPQPHGEFTSRFAAGARQHAGTPAEPPYLYWIVRMSSDGDAIRDAAARLIEHHTGSRETAGVAAQLQFFGERVGSDRAIALCDALLARAPAGELRAKASFARAELRGAADEQARALAMADLLEAKEHVPAAQVGLAQRIDGALFELERLQIGMVAPDIEGEDLDGVRFALGDYRGKVVVLDFWGDW